MITDEQNLVISAKTGYYLVIAGAGTGKTTSIVNRVVNLIDGGVRPEKILGITFTVKAGREMKNRVEEKLGQTQATFTNYHSLAYRLFKKYQKHIGWTDLRIIGEKKFRDFLYESFISNNVSSRSDDYEDSQFETFVKSLKKIHIENCNTDILTGGQLIAYTNAITRLKNEGYITFDLLIYTVTQFFTNNPRFNIGKLYEYVIVDEAQDTNRIQFEFIKLLNSSGNLMLVGDPNQSIMRFQGAEVKNIFQFAEDFKAKILYLSKCFRCPEEVVSVMNTILKQSLYDEKYRKDGVSLVGGKEKPKLYIKSSPDEMATFITNNITSLLDDGYEPKHFTVLFRGRQVSLHLQKAFLLSGIPFKIKSGDFLNRAEVQYTLTALQLKPGKRLGISDYATLAQPMKIGISSGTIRRLLSLDNVSSLEAVINKNTKIQGIGQTKQSSLFTLRDNLSDLTNQTHNISKTKQIEPLVERIDSILCKNVKTHEERKKIKSGLEILSELWDTFQKSNAKDKGVSEFTNLIQIENEDDDSEKNSVTLSTIHSYKGLENEVVYLAGVNEPFFPSHAVLDSDTYMDNINLFYVASSRAKRKMIYLACESFQQELNLSLMSMFSKTDLIDMSAEDKKKMSKCKTDFYKFKTP